jgi:hypothetical protein
MASESLRCSAIFPSLDVDSISVTTILWLRWQARWKKDNVLRVVEWKAGQNLRNWWRWKIK